MISVKKEPGGPEASIDSFLTFLSNANPTLKVLILVQMSSDGLCGITVIYLLVPEIERDWTSGVGEFKIAQRFL